MRTLTRKILLCDGVEKNLHYEKAMTLLQLSLVIYICPGGRRIIRMIQNLPPYRSGVLAKTQKNPLMLRQSGINIPTISDFDPLSFFKSF
jgi:hypothetical protein